MTQVPLWQPSDIVNPEAEGDAEGDSPKRRSRIPQSAWPRIQEMHKSGATLSAIAREFDCTPSAISYILRKAEPVETTATPSTEPTLAIPTATPVPSVAPTTPVAEPAAKPAERRTLTAAAVAEAVQERMAPPPVSVQQRPPERPPVSASTSVAAPRPAMGQSAAEPNDGQPAAVDYSYRNQHRNAARIEANEAPAEPADQRLGNAAKACADAYRTWQTNRGETGMQPLSDSIHELRRVIARMEIEMSAVRKEEHAARPIPIPQHRANNQRR